VPAIKLGRIQISSDALIVAALGIVAAFAIGQCGGQVIGADAERDRINAENSRKALQYSRHVRRDNDRWADSVAQVSAAWAKERRLMARRQRIADSVSRDAAGVVADAGATREQLRKAGEVLARANAILSSDLTAVRAQADSLAAIVATFPARLAADRVAADSLDAKRVAEIAELRNRAECRIAQVFPCPTRVQSYLAGAGSILVLLVFGL
jgi:hypothetical protein